MVKSVYKSNDILSNDNRYLLKNYFNPYEYNLESNLKDKKNYDIEYMKSINCVNRNRIKNK